MREFIDLVDMKIIIGEYYNSDIDWWCDKYDFIKNETLSAKTIYKHSEDDNIIPTFGFIILEDKTVVDVDNIILSHKRDTTIKNILKNKNEI
jgi:hypothetical protein